ncbi:MAG: helix-turn-helix transcriptional regulator [Candidatus Omnitrophota bacterium]|nr:helix-turn-helix transcriptional regulator [Candidatus Omnitrophota bacterium]
MDMIDRLEHYRLENKITQQILAKKLGVAFTTVNRWLKRHVSPSPIQEYQIKKLISSKPERRKYDRLLG